MNLYIISDTHFNHANIATYCQRPENFTELIIARWNQTVQPNDFILHLGDVAIGKKTAVRDILTQLNGVKGLIRGNHDRDKSVTWWMENGFNFACDSLTLRQVYFTHEPAEQLAPGCHTNVHGHLHNIWDGFIDERRWQRDKEHLGIDFKRQLKHKWQRLFSVEYTDYRPVELSKFLAHPERYKAIGPGDIFKLGARKEHQDVRFSNSSDQDPS
jgi:calcineurin-like phosphoesterase family protein